MKNIALGLFSPNSKSFYSFKYIYIYQFAFHFHPLLFSFNFFNSKTNFRKLHRQKIAWKCFVLKTTLLESLKRIRHLSVLAERWNISLYFEETIEVIFYLWIQNSYLTEIWLYFHLRNKISNKFKKSCPP